MQTEKWDDNERNQLLSVMRRFGGRFEDTATVSAAFFGPSQPGVLGSIFATGACPDEDTAATLARWQTSTRRLLVLSAGSHEPLWLYGWLMFGVVLRARAELLGGPSLAELRHAIMTFMHDAGVTHPDELPHSVEGAEMLLGRPAVRELERLLCRELLKEPTQALAA